MTVAVDNHYRHWSGHHSHHQPAPVTLEDKYEVVKEIGDGSFGSVVLGRTRTAAAGVVRRNTMVAIKTMKKSFDSFAQCLELREVIFLKTLPPHQHLIPTYDIFLDPLSRKLHIAMEYMDGNLYQLMKSRDHKPLDGASVKSILFQILSGLEHIHEHDFFHRDIKPENILVSSSSPESSSAFKRYSLSTPPSSPPTYSIKLADFGLARETHSSTPYTTYVSTRWYRAPEVLLRAGTYGAPVDIWALGAMAVEIATLKPLFPGANEVDQVWRVCEIMGSPGLWVNKHGARVGGGEWKDGVRLAQKLGFSFPKMAPHSLQTILPSSQWPASLAEFITWCLLWDPKTRPTSTQALAHEYFADAVDPLRPKSSTASRLLGRARHSHVLDSPDSQQNLTSKTSSWFRRSLGPRDHGSPVIPSEPAEKPLPQPQIVRQPPIQILTETPSVRASDKSPSIPAPAVVPRSNITVAKRESWPTVLNANNNPAPMTILPSIRPVSPLSDAATALGNTTSVTPQEQPSKKLGRQLSVNSTTNHYAEYHRQEAEKLLNGGSSGLTSPTSASKESFFAHLRKRARRFSGKHQMPISPPSDEADGYDHGSPSMPYSNRTSLVMDSPNNEYDPLSPSKDSGFAELDKVLNNVRYGLEGRPDKSKTLPEVPKRVPSFSALRRHDSVKKTNPEPQAEVGLGFARNRKSVRYTLQHGQQYETPDEEDELLNEALTSADHVSRQLDRKVSSTSNYVAKPVHTSNPYLTPSPSKENNAIIFTRTDGPSKPVDIKETPPRMYSLNPQWPTPPYDDNEWAAAAAASIFAAAAAQR